MSAAIEAAAEAVSELEWGAQHGGVDPTDWEIASAALSAALPHLTEGLAEVIQKAREDALCRWQETGDPGGTPAQIAAIAAAEELKRRITDAG